MRHGETGAGSVYHAKAAPYRSLPGATVAPTSHAEPEPGTNIRPPRTAFVRWNEPGGVQSPASAAGAANSRMPPIKPRASSFNERISDLLSRGRGKPYAGQAGSATRDGP